MPVHFACPHCQASLSTAKRKIGLAVPCPQCRIGVLVPTPVAKFAVARQETAVAPAAKSHLWGVLFILAVLGCGGWCLQQISAATSPAAPKTEIAVQPVVPVALAIHEQQAPLAVVEQPEKPGPRIIELQGSREAKLPLLPQQTVKQELQKPPLPPLLANKQAEPQQPIVTPKAPQPPAPTPVKVAAFPRWSEEELRRELARTPELRLKTQTAHQLLLQATALQQQMPVRVKHATDLMSLQQPELAGLPFRKGHSCELERTQAERLHQLSQRMRLLMQSSATQSSGLRDGSDMPPNPHGLRTLMKSENVLVSNTSSDDLFELVGQLIQKQSQPPIATNYNDWLKPTAIPTLTQMLQGERAPLRLIMVELLGQIPGEEASVALAQRAVFDLSQDVRQAAVERLRQRPISQYRQELLNAFQHPWLPASYHAAEALAFLNDKESVPQISALLTEPDPTKPFFMKKDASETLVVKEMIRVNHLSNCLMCHSPSFAQNDLVRGKIPITGQPLSSPGIDGTYGGTGPGTFIRADITYLRQDFSVTQPVLNAGFWPKMQRFDYLVRLRAPTKTELLRLTDPENAPKLKYTRDDVLRLALSRLAPTSPLLQPPVETPPDKGRQPDDNQPPQRLSKPENWFLARRSE